MIKYSACISPIVKKEKKILKKMFKKNKKINLCFVKKKFFSK
jgi:hypothetical protein